MHVSYADMQRNQRLYLHTAHEAMPLLLLNIHTSATGRKALDYLDLTWVLEIGDCELKLLDSTWSEEVRAM